MNSNYTSIRITSVIMRLMSSSIKILAFVGLAGSGKSSAVEYMTEKGFPKIYFGGILYKAAAKAGIKPGDWDAEKKFREDIREKEGKDFVVKRAIVEARNLIDAGQKHIILDGLYTWSEYKVLKHEFPGNTMTVVAIVTSKHLRYERMANRPKRPMTSEEVDARDWAEIENIEKGGPIAIADYFVQNDEDIENMNSQIETILKEIDF